MRDFKGGDNMTVNIFTYNLWTQFDTPFKYNLFDLSSHYTIIKQESHKFHRVIQQQMGDPK